MAQRVGNDPGAEVLVHRQRLLADRRRTGDGVLALRDGDLGQVLALGAVEVHVPLGQQREAVPRRQEAGVGLEGHGRRNAAGAVGAAPAAARGWRAVADLGAAQAPLGLLQRHQRDADLGLARRNRRGRQAERSGRAAAARGQGGCEADLLDAQHRPDRRRVAGVGIDGEAVQVLDGEAGVVERRQDGRAGHGEFGFGDRLPPIPILRGPHPDDGGLVFQCHPRLLRRVSGQGPAARARFWNQNSKNLRRLGNGAQWIARPGRAGTMAPRACISPRRI